MKTLLLIGTMSLLGCGGSGAVGIDAWVGNWTSATSEVETCSDGTHTTPLDGALPITAGSEDLSVVTMSTNGCDLSWTLAGDTATLMPNQMCSVPGSVGGTWMPSFTSGTLKISINDKGTGVLDDAGTMTSCTFTQSGTFTKS